MRSSSAVRRLVASLGFALAVASSASAARATVAQPCGYASAYARPGPIRAGQAAVRFVPPEGESRVDPSLLTLTDSDGGELAVSVENLPDGSAFLRVGIELEPGTYELAYAAGCMSGEPLELDVPTSAGAEDPNVLGELTLDYEPYCIGYHADGTGAPPVTATLTLSAEVIPYEPFLTLDLHANGTTWVSGVASLARTAPLVPPPSLAYSRESNCTLGSKSVPNELFFTATASIVDGPVLPPLEASIDARCADCSDYVGGNGTTSGADDGGATSQGELGTNPPRHGGCTLASGEHRHEGGLVALAFAACVALRRRATRRASPRVTGSRASSPPSSRRHGCRARRPTRARDRSRSERRTR